MTIAEQLPSGAVEPAREANRAASRGMTFQPGLAILRSALGHRPPDVTSAASEKWTIAPSSTVEVRPARYLPGQLDRIRGSEFGTIDEVVRDFRGGFDTIQAPTTGFLIRDVMLLDGLLYARDAATHLRRRSRLRIAARKPEQHGRAAMYESWAGNRWFGSWLLDDCLAFQLAETCADPVASDAPLTIHQTAYERLLGMRPKRVSSAWFEELILFDDTSHNASRRERSDRLRAKLTRGPVRRHPGVFLLRGATGDLRLLSNELAIAERLNVGRGFTVIDPEKSDLDEILSVCQGADVIAGVEGSQLVHGLMVMAPGSRALVLQPPTRVVSILKLLTDRQGLEYMTVIGIGDDTSFWIDPDEIERTLDLN